MKSELAAGRSLRLLAEPCVAVLCTMMLAACAASGSAEWESRDRVPDQRWLFAAEHASGSWIHLSQDESRAASAPPTQDASGEAEAAQPERRGFLIEAALYLPNRIFDLFDIVRARARVGPGLSLGARATRPASFALGAHDALYLGLPGPRGEVGIPWPAGIERYSGAELSVVNGLRAGNVHYGMGEVGLGTQLFLLGVDVGVDVWEVVDFAVGLATFDPVEDDF